eukprot:TRINITY_DN12308_c2_g8_i3.p1 TRINITY_DN12308_c2_g8~~TRINITY_DN12308_c2_g8_i3.p1  ORF type:complete len:156 (+),score=24.61 TRINITY_DN12308_c2_g8_i3:149-616(+)
MSIAEGSAVLSEEFKEDLIKVVNRAHRFHSITQDGAWSILALPSSPLLQQGPMCGITASIVAAGTLELTRKRKAWHFNSTASPENSQPSSLLDVPDDMESRLARLDIDSADLLKYLRLLDTVAACGRCCSHRDCIASRPSSADPLRCRAKSRTLP